MKSKMPEIGRPADEVLAELKGFAGDDPDYRHGRLWSLVYYLDEAMTERVLEMAERAVADGAEIEVRRFAA